MDYIKFSFLILLTFSFSQELDSTLTLEKKSLMILPSSSSEYESISDDILSIISQKATALGRYDVIDRNLVDDILAEQKFQYSGNVSDEDIVAIGEMAAAEEALILNMIHFGQRGVPPQDKKNDKEEKNETLFSWVVKKTVESALYNSEKEKAERKEILDNNIQTVIQANVKLVNVENGKSLQSFDLNSEYTGGNKDASLKHALKIIKYQLNQKLKGLYTITSEVVSVKGKTITILNGENLGLQMGDVFEINSKDKTKSYQGKQISFPGKTRGLAKITQVGVETSQAQIIRKWRKIKTGNRAYEMMHNPFVGDICIGSSEQRFDLFVRGWLNPFNRVSGSVNLMVGALQDSRNDRDFYFGLGTTLDCTILSGFGTQISTSLDIPFNIVSRSDDERHTVTGLVVMPAFELNAFIQIAKDMDIVLTAKQTLGSNSPNWQYPVVTGKDEDGNDEVEWKSAVWTDNTPDIQPIGLTVSFGIRRYWF